MGSDSQQPEIALDTKLLSDFIYELNIARRCGMAYPQGHPRIQASAKKVMGLLRQVLEFREKLTVGIAREVIVIDKFHLDKKNPVYRDYAKGLFQLGVVALSIHKELTEEEFLQFNAILCLTREKLKDQGGFASALKASEIKNLEIQLIDYGLFQVYEGERTPEVGTEGKRQESDSIWQEFVEGVLENSMPSSDLLKVLNDGRKDDGRIRPVRAAL